HTDPGVPLLLDGRDPAIDRPLAPGAIDGCEVPSDHPDLVLPGVTVNEDLRGPRRTDGLAVDHDPGGRRSLGGIGGESGLSRRAADHRGVALPRGDRAGDLPG